MLYKVLRNQYAQSARCYVVTHSYFGYLPAITAAFQSVGGVVKVHVFIVVVSDYHDVSSSVLKSRPPSSHLRQLGRTGCFLTSIPGSCQAALSVPRRVTIPPVSVGAMPGMRSPEGRVVRKLLSLLLFFSAAQGTQNICNFLQ